LERLEVRVVLTSGSDWIPDVVVNEDAANTVIDLDAVFGNPALGLTSPFTYSVAASTPIENLVTQVSESNYTAVLQDLLYTHSGDNRGLWGPQHALARDNIAAYFTSLGLQTALEPFNYNYTSPPTLCHNVVGILPGTERPNDIYLVGAHYDSANNPGADDNASGTAAVMEIARVLSQYSFDATLVFVAFDCEELNLLGSLAYVNAHPSDNILGMVNLDMIAYNAPAAGHDSISLYDCVAGGVMKSQLAAAFTAYGDGLTTVDGGYTTASDHYWFEKRGFDAALVIESGWASNPQYHRAGDAVETENYLDYAYATRVSRGTLGYLATAAGLQTTNELLTATETSGDLALDYTADANGTADIRVQVRDALNRIVEDTFRVTVNSVNDLPTLDPIEDRVIGNEQPSVTIPLAGISSGDGIGQPVRVTAVSSAPEILSNPAVEYVRLAGHGTLTLVPVAHANGNVVVTVQIEDGGIDGQLATAADNAVTSRMFTVAVLPPQHPPTATPDTYSMPENGTLSIPAPGVLTNDVDIDGDSLQAELVSAASHGVVQLHQDGSFTYTPNALFNREDVFNYTASDGTHNSQPVTVQIVVNTAYPWYNGSESCNVNDDGYFQGGIFVPNVSPLDALLVINELNRAGSRKLPVDRPRPLAPPFYDVNRDSFITPLDALWVINYLNRKKGGGEGEGERDGDVLESGESLLVAPMASPRDGARFPSSGPTLPNTIAELPATLISFLTGTPPTKVGDFHSWEDDDTQWVPESLEDLLSEFARG
jgi:hypothetical protein